MAHHLLTTKYQLPPLPTRVVRRRRLLETLDRSLQPSLRLTLISAPAGYGKTTLLRTWIEDRALPAAWFSLDESDNDPARFLNYLLAAFQQGFPELTLPSVPGVTSSDIDIQGLVLIPLINELGRSPDLKLLALDDYHFLQNQTIHDHVGYLLDHLPPQAHVFIATRADPPLPINRLRGRGQLNQLRMDDLRFQMDEARSLLEMVAGFDLDPIDIQRLTHRTEGWVSGLQMAAISLQDQEDRDIFLKNFSGTDQYIMDYLLDEVLSRQPAELQDFLLETSILDRICGPLCDAIQDDSSPPARSGTENLDRLDRANLFVVPLDTKREWYRYHRLFADLLKARLQMKAADRVPVLHRKASEWFEKQALMEEAVHHALLTQDQAFTADLVERTAQEMLMRSETTTLLRWVQHLPDDQIRRRPRLGIYRAWALLFLGAPFSSFEDQLEPEPDLQGPPGSALTMRAFIMLFQGETERGFEIAQQALRELPEEEIFLREFTSYCIAAALIGLGQDDAALQQLEQSTLDSQRSGNRAAMVLILGEIAEQRMKHLQLDEAEQLYRRALNLSRSDEGGLLPIAGQAIIGLGDLALERFDLEDAARQLKQGIELTERWSLIGTLKGHFSMAMLHNALGDRGATRESLATLKDLARRFDITEFDDLVVEMLENDIRVRHGELDAVRDWVVRQGLDRAPGQRSPTTERDALVARLYRYQLPILIRLEIAEGQFDRALELLDDLLRMSSDPYRPFLQVEARLLQALALRATGQLPRALDALQQALEIALPAQIMRLFIVEGEHLLELLESGRALWASAELTAFVDCILHKAGRTVSGRPLAPTSLAEALSPREAEVLGYLATGMTADELAQELIISTNTVRSHIKSIYAKLGVHNRQQALIRAAELELL